MNKQNSFSLQSDHNQNLHMEFNPQTLQVSNNPQQLAENQLMHAFWANQLISANQDDQDFKTHTLPIARIKKVMKSEDEAKHLVYSINLDDISRSSYYICACL